MSGPLKSALLGMLPTYTPATIPLPLIQLAIVLLAQSRSRAGSLKKEEEVARTCACAEIACRRLQTRLNLPQIHCQPPCPPRIYKRLYDYLDSALITPALVNKAADLTTNSTPTKMQNAMGANLLVTPSKRALPPSPATPTPKKQKHDGRAPGMGEVPPWIAPTIRHLCKKFDAPAAVPHIYVGVLSILRERPAIVGAQTLASSLLKRTPTVAPPDASDKEDGAIPALVITVMLLVLERMRLGAGAVEGDEMDVNGDGLDVSAISRRAAKEFVALGRINVRRAGPLVAAVERMVEEDWAEWKEMEWWGNVPVGGDATQTGERASKDANGGQDEEGDLEEHEMVRVVRTAELGWRKELQGMAMGLGSVNWLSETRRQDYRAWKAGIMKEVEKIERAPAYVAA